MKNYFKNFKLNRFIDSMVFATCIFLIFFAFARFAIKDFTTSLIIALTFCIGLSLIRKLVKHKQENRNLLKTEQKEKMEKCIFSLMSSSQDENINLFKKILLAQNIDIFMLNECIITNNNTAIYIDFESEILNKSKTIKALKLIKNNGYSMAKILCASVDIKDRKLLNNIENLEVTILEKEEVFSNYFQKTDIYPQEVLCMKPQSKLKFREFIDMSLTKEKSKKYFLSGLLIFFCSIIVRYNFYYVFMSSILFLLAILSRSHKSTVA